jgi:Sigma-70 region 2
MGVDSFGSLSLTGAMLFVAAANGTEPDEGGGTDTLPISGRLGADLPSPRDRHRRTWALQEALLRTWRGLSRVEGRSSLRPWLYKIVTNAGLDVA